MSIDIKLGKNEKMVYGISESGNKIELKWRVDGHNEQWQIDAVRRLAIKENRCFVCGVKILHLIQCTACDDIWCSTECADKHSDPYDLHHLIFEGGEEIA